MGRNSATDGETAFWESTFKEAFCASNPSWVGHLVHRPGESVERRNVLGTQDVLLYLVDTSNLWILGGAATSEDMKKARSIQDESPVAEEFAVANAGSLILDCSTRKLKHDDKDAIAAASVSLAALAATQAYRYVMSKLGSPAGHWVYLVYRLADATAVARPVFIRKRERLAFIDPDELTALVKRVVAQDLADPQGSISRNVMQAGGVTLHESLKV